MSTPRGVCSGVFALGDVCSRGCLLQGVSALGGVCSRGVSAPGGGIPACTEADTPPSEQNDRQVQKYYLGHNFVAAGKKGKLKVDLS